MIGLVSFGRIVYDELGTDNFLFFYLSAAFFSSYTSWIWKLVSSRAAVFSLGASGAVYAVMALAALINPNLRISIIFFPFASFNARWCFAERP